MSVLLPIGEFSRMTYLTIKALRHYHDLGLLEPAEIDASSGYRLYSTAQVPTALLISRFRDLEMPLDEVRDMLHAPDVATRNQIILAHLDRMQDRLAKTQGTVESLKLLLDVTPPVAVEFRALATTPCLAIRASVTMDECEAWLIDAYREIDDLLAVAGITSVGPAGALYPEAFFSVAEGAVVAFAPVADTAAARAAARGRAQPDELDAGNFAIAVHAGSFADIDQTYGALGTYVAEHRLGAAGAVREHYLAVGSDAASDQRTEVCWPIMPTIANP